MSTELNYIKVRPRTIGARLWVLVGDRSFRNNFHSVSTQC